MKRVLSSLILFCFFVVGFPGSLTFFVNEKPFQTLTDGFDLSRIYELTFEGKDYDAVPLREFLPIMESVDQLVIANSKDGQTTVYEDVRRGLLPFSVLLSREEPDQWLFFDGAHLFPFSSLSLFGDVAPKGALEVWVSWEGVPLLKTVIQQFSEHYGIPVKVLEVPNTATKLLSMLKAGGKVPDLVMIQCEGFEELVLSKAFQQVDALYDGFESLYAPDVFSLDNKRWAIPFYGDTQLLFYRKDRIPKLPEPLSLQELETLASELTTGDSLGLGWNLFSVYWFAPFQIGFGKESILEPDGSVKIQDSATAQALAFLKTWVDRQIAIPLERDAMVSMFTSGKLAMILSGSYSIPSFEELGIPFGITSYPYNAETGRWISPMLDFKGFGITRKTREPVLAMALLEYLTGPGAQTAFCIPVNKIPVNREVLGDQLETGGEVYQLYKHALDVGTYVPAYNAYDLYKNTLWKLLRFVFLDQMSIPEVLEKGQQIIDANVP